MSMLPGVFIDQAGPEGVSITTAWMQEVEQRKEQLPRMIRTK